MRIPPHRQFWGLSALVTLLAILGTNSIGVPLSPTFPASELHYILENSGALMLLSSAKFRSKAEEVMHRLKDKPPISSSIPKRAGGTSSSENIEFEKIQDFKGGIMLYTSGTTNRPVRNPKAHMFPGQS